MHPIGSKLPTYHALSSQGTQATPGGKHPTPSPDLSLNCLPDRRDLVVHQSQALQWEDWTAAYTNGSATPGSG